MIHAMTRLDEARYRYCTLYNGQALRVDKRARSASPDWTTRRCVSLGRRDVAILQENAWVRQGVCTYENKLLFE